MSLRRLGLAPVLALGALVSTACTRPQPTSGAAAPLLPAGAPVVLVSIDTLRSDRLPSYGYRFGETPAIDRLAREGVLFEHAYSHVPLTLPSHASLLTGLLPDRHGVRDNTGYRLDSSHPSLVRNLRATGYATAGAVSALVLAKSTGIAEGFDLYDDALHWGRESLLGRVQRSGNDTLDTVLPWLSTHAGQPFVLFLHLYEPHSPYTPPEPFASRHLGRSYDGEIAVADAVLGRLLAALESAGAYDRSLIVLLSDHGEGLGDHGEAEHGVLLYREAIQVPLILKLPAARHAGTRVRDPVALVDLYPTLAPLWGEPPTLPTDDPLAPRSLLTNLTTDHPPAQSQPRMILSESLYPRLRFGWSELVSVVAGNWHAIHGPDPELYDLRLDPAERVNQRDRERGALRPLLAAARAYDTRYHPPTAVDPEQARALAALGYVAGPSPADTESPLPDPKQRIGDLDGLGSGFQAFARGDLEAAERDLAGAVERLPRLTEAWETLALVHERRGDPSTALATFRRGIAAVGASSEGAVELTGAAAAMMLRARQAETALALVREQLTRTPAADRLRSVEARACLLLDRPQCAVAAADRVVTAFPAEVEAYYERAVARLMAGDMAGAERDFLQTLTMDPDHLAARNDLSVLLAHAGRQAEAIAQAEEVLRRRPEDGPARRNLESWRRQATPEPGSG